MEKQLQSVLSLPLKEFEDIIEDAEIDSLNQKKYEDDDSDTLIHKVDANSLTLKDLLQELERRDIQPRGFFSDDAKILQDVLDKEHEQYMESKRIERQKARDLEASQAILKHRKTITETQAREEQEEIDHDIEARTWLLLIQSGRAPAHSRIKVNDITARLLARHLWSNSNIVSLDVGNMKLSDISGAYLARAMKNNKTIAKLEMGENLLGPKTCSVLADSLKSNKSLKFLSLEANQLIDKNGASCVKPLCNIICKNNSLRYLNLWRCNIGVEGGRLMSDAMMNNSTLTCLDLGYNSWDFTDIQNIKTALEKNLEIYKRERDILAQQRKKNDQSLKKEQEAELDRKRQEEQETFLCNKKFEREEVRRKEMERLESDRRTEETMRERDRERQLAEEEEKKSKKKTKRKKNKKKK